MHIGIVGAGIAGASVAYAAYSQGWQVTVFDHTGPLKASTVPAALINPVRGRYARANAQSLEGASVSLAWIKALAAQGYGIEHSAAGFVRRVPTHGFSEDPPLKTQWVDNLLKANVPHQWLDDERVLIKQAGWVNGPQLVEALLAASNAKVIQTRVGQIGTNQVSCVQDNDDQSSLVSSQFDAVVFCGGAHGLQQLQHQSTMPSKPVYSPGGELIYRMSHAGQEQAASAVTAWHAGDAFIIEQMNQTVIGASLEGQYADWLPDNPELIEAGFAALEADANNHLPDIAQGSAQRWRGMRVRLAQPFFMLNPSNEQSSAQFTPQLNSPVWALCGLGSRGFLMGPLLAQQLIKQLAQTPEG